MHDHTVSAPLAPQAQPSPAAPFRGQAVFQAVIDSGLLRCAVPQAQGGHGGGLADLAAGALALAARQPACAWVLWAQRLAVEALLHSGNAGLRDHLLPDLLAGERAGTLPPSLDRWPLQALDTGHGWRLHGRLARVPNLQWVGHSLAAPVRFGPGPDDLAWVWLRGEEDGFDATPLPDGGARTGSQDADMAADLVLRGVYFREDEWLAGPELAARIAPVAQALRAAVPGR